MTFTAGGHNSVLSIMMMMMMMMMSYVCVFVLMCVEKDVARTDRTHAFFHGDNNPNISVLYDVLLTHCMYNFDLG